MSIDWIRSICRALPHTTEGVQWDNDLLFRVANKMFTVVALEPDAKNRVAFKVTPEEFAELVERDGVIPAPYMARNHWISLQRWDALPARETARLIRQSYALVVAKLPQRVQAELGTAPAAVPAKAAPKKTPAARMKAASKPAKRAQRKR